MPSHIDDKNYDTDFSHTVTFIVSKLLDIILDTNQLGLAIQHSLTLQLHHPNPSLLNVEAITTMAWYVSAMNTQCMMR